jgi:drug/metabolite transporter, DME family
VFGVLLARVVLKERLTRATIAAVFVAFIGLVIMVAGDLGAGSMIGNMSALMAAVGFAGYTVCVRSDPQEDWSSVLPGYAVMMIVICVATTLAHGKPLVPPAVDLAYALIHGGVFIVLGTILFNASSRRVPAGTMTVLAQTEMVLVPVWSYLLLGERPKTSTLVGGLIILGAIMTKAIIDARGPDAQPAEALEYIL